jgi:pimeloyl-ACP methyl ester carboxylesterase
MTAPAPFPALVLLHHFGGSARSWEFVVAALGSGFDTIALDLPGFGDAAGASGPYTLEAYADHVEARLLALGCAGFVLIGHSMGGKVALAVAARRPVGLRAVVLLAPSPPTPEPIPDVKRAELIAGWAQYSMASRTLADATAEPLADEARRLAIDDLMRAGKAGWTAWLMGGSREDISGHVGAIEVPVTILSGDCDTLLPTALIRQEVASRLRDPRLITVGGAGHLLPLEVPAAVATTIRNVLADFRAADAQPDRAA